MYRLVNLRFSRIPNTMFRRGDLVAIQDIRRGECIRVPRPKRVYRSAKDRKEIDRLGDVSYWHAIKN